MTFLISTFGPVVISWFFIAHRRIASGYFCLGAAVARRRPSDRPSLRSVVSIARGEAHESETDGRVAAAAVPTTRRTRLSARARPGLTGRPAGGSPWLGEPPTRADPPTHHRINGGMKRSGGRTQTESRDVPRSCRTSGSCRRRRCPRTHPPPGGSNQDRTVCVRAVDARRRSSDRPSLRSVFSIDRAWGGARVRDWTTRSTRLSGRARPGLLSGPAGWWASAHPPGSRQTHHKMRTGDEEERGRKSRDGVPRRTAESSM